MTNANFESIAGARRASELLRISVERERVARAIADNAVGQSGTQRPAAQTADLEKLAGDLDSRAARLRDLAGDELVAEYCSEYLPG